MKAVTAFFFLGWFILAGCSGTGHKDGKSLQPVTVRMTNTLKYVPEKVTIQRGQTVIWKNTSDLVHTVTCDPQKAAKAGSVELPPGAKPFRSSRIAPDSTFSYTFTVKGTYKYFCILHEATGMVGYIIVK